MAQPRNEAVDAPTILVVDDTPMNLSVLVRILEGSGYRILVARNGRLFFTHDPNVAMGRVGKDEKGKFSTVDEAPVVKEHAN